MQTTCSQCKVLVIYDSLKVALAFSFSDRSCFIVISEIPYLNKLSCSFKAHKAQIWIWGLSLECQAKLVNNEYGLNEDEDSEAANPASSIQEDLPADEHTVNLDESLEDQIKKKAIDKLFVSACCSLGSKKGAVRLLLMLAVRVRS